MSKLCVTFYQKHISPHHGILLGLKSKDLEMVELVKAHAFMCVELYTVSPLRNPGTSAYGLRVNRMGCVCMGGDLV